MADGQPIPDTTLKRLYAESDAVRFGFSETEFAALTAQVDIAAVRVNDLVLARACARGNDVAWDEFLIRYRPKLYFAAMAIARDQAVGRDLADSLYADLYGTRVQESGRRISKLESFQGRGSLEGWLKTILAQEYVNRFRSQRKLVVFDDSLEAPIASEPVNQASSADHAALAKAMDGALATLDEEERFLLASYYLDERTLAEIGRILGNHESTVSRRLEKITGRLRKQVVGLLCKEGIAKRAAEEMLTLDVRDLTVNVREKLAQERRA